MEKEKTTKTKMSEKEILEQRLRRIDEKRKYIQHQKELGKEMKLVKYLGKKIIREQLFPDAHKYGQKKDFKKEAILDIITTLESHIYASTADHYRFPIISRLKTSAHSMEYTLMMHAIFETMEKYKKSEEISTSASSSLTMKKLAFLQDDYIF